MELPMLVHVIDSMGIGGAEAMLASLLPDLSKHYQIVLVTLDDVEMPPDFIASAGIRHHSLKMRGAKGLPEAVWKLRRLIKLYRPVLVRSQLFMSSIVARLATPRHIPMIFSIHSVLSQDAFAKNRWALLVERLSYRKRHTLLAVSKTALEDYRATVGIKGRSQVLWNCVRDAFFEAPRPVRWRLGEPLRLVAVGNLKAAKNYEWLLQRFEIIAQKYPVTLDIIGEGPLRPQLQQQVVERRLSVNLLGNKEDVSSLLPNYHAYISTSVYEGFGIAPAEAMAVGLPVLLTNLEVYYEMSGGHAIFFDPKTDEIQSVFAAIFDGSCSLGDTATASQAWAMQFFSKEQYLKRIIQFYRREIDIAR